MIESVKATTELFSAISGEIVAVNSELVEHPELINNNELMDAIAYEQFIS